MVTMNISCNDQSYYIDRNTGASVQLITNKGNATDLLPELSPKEVYRKSTSSSRSSTSTTSSSTPKVIYELDGEEIDPVEMLFQRHPETKEDKMKKFWKEKRKSAKVRFIKFREYNEKIIAQNEANPLENDQNFRSTLKGLKSVSRKKSAERYLGTEPTLNIKKNARDANPKSRACSANSFLKLYLDDDNENNNEQANDYNNNNNNSNNSTPEKAQEQANPITQTIWNYFNYYWGQTKNAEVSPEAAGAMEERPIIKKVYTRQKNGHLVLLDAEEVARRNNNDTNVKRIENSAAVTTHPKSAKKGAAASTSKAPKGAKKNATASAGIKKQSKQSAQNTKNGGFWDTFKLRISSIQGMAVF